MNGDDHHWQPPTQSLASTLSVLRSKAGSPHQHLFPGLPLPSKGTPCSRPPPSAVQGAHVFTPSLPRPPPALGTTLAPPPLKLQLHEDRVALPSAPPALAATSAPRVKAFVLLTHSSPLQSQLEATDVRGAQIACIKETAPGHMESSFKGATAARVNPPKPTEPGNWQYNECSKRWNQRTSGKKSTDDQRKKRKDNPEVQARAAAWARMRCDDRGRSAGSGDTAPNATDQHEGS